MLRNHLWVLEGKLRVFVHFVVTGKYDIVTNIIMGINAIPNKHPVTDSHTLIIPFKTRGIILRPKLLREKSLFPFSRPD